MREEIEFVQVRGARLYTEKRGSGPALVLISGGGGDAEMYEPASFILAEHFTVITYDRRGNSRSLLTRDAEPSSPRIQAEDVVAILDAYGIRRAYLFGSSAGGVIALETIARHSDRLIAAIVHEPPIASVLPDPQVGFDFLDGIDRIYEAEGGLPAFLYYASFVMNTSPRLFASRGGRAAASVFFRVALFVGSWWAHRRHREPDGMHRLIGNIDALVHGDAQPMRNYVPDLDALAHVDVPWAMAGSVQSTRRFWYDASHIIAERTGTPWEQFPAGHTPYQQAPEEFSRLIRAMFDLMTVRPRANSTSQLR